MLNTASEQALLNTYYGILFDVFMMLIFLVLFKVGLVYLMAWMSKWVDEKPETDDAAMAEKGNSKKIDVSKFPLNQKLLWYGLSSLWILNGVLQIPAKMVIMTMDQLMQEPTFQHQPHWLAMIMQSGAHFWVQHAINLNISSILLQIIIGVLLLWGRGKWFGKLGLWMSIVYASFIWIFWEGFGEVFTGSESIVNGSPGAALFYIITAIVLLLPQTMWLSGKLPRWSYKGFGVFMALAALWQAVYFPFWSSSLMRIFPTAKFELTQPTFISTPLQSISHMISSNTALWNAIFIVMMIALSVLILIKEKLKSALTIGIGWLLLFWWFGQDFGLLGGYGLNVNSSPILILFIISMWVQDTYAKKEQTKKSQVQNSSTMMDHSL